MLGLLTVLSNAVAPATALATAGASDSWQETMLASRTPNGETPKTLDEMMLKFPVQMDWMIQDNGLDLTKWFKATDTGNETSMIKRVLLELGDAGKPFQDNLDSLVNGKIPGNDRRWLDLYVNACEKRRAMRLKTLLQKAPKIVFVKHHIIMPAFFAYTEGQSDAQNERHFPADSARCLLEMNGMYGTVKTLLEDKTGRIRDPAVSYDGKRILFAWKKSLNEDDCHLYEMEAASGNIRQLTRNCVKCHKGESPDLPFSLTSHENIDEQSKRKWSDSYMALTQARKNAGSIAPGDVSFSGWPGRVVNWAGTQSGPEMLPPYSAGAAKSKLIAMLAKGHKKVKLSAEDLERIAAWIDLYVPYCGDYTEANAWSDDEVKKYNHFMEKRKMMEEQIQRNIDDFIGNKPNQ